LNLTLKSSKIGPFDGRSVVRPWEPNVGCEYMVISFSIFECNICFGLSTHHIFEWLCGIGGCLQAIGPKSTPKTVPTDLIQHPSIQGPKYLLIGGTQNTKISRKYSAKNFQIFWGTNLNIELVLCHFFHKKSICSDRRFILKLTWNSLPSKQQLLSGGANHPILGTQNAKKSATKNFQIFFACYLHIKLAPHHFFRKKHVSANCSVILDLTLKSSKIQCILV